MEERCPTCGMPQISDRLRSKPRIGASIRELPENHEPDLVVRTCPACAAKGLGQAAHRVEEPRTLKRFIRCENYEECETSYPLPQYGKLTATEGNLPRLRRAYGNRDHRARPVEAVPEL